jgi:hypothetical protein
MKKRFYIVLPVLCFHPESPEKAAWSDPDLSGRKELLISEERELAEIEAQKFFEINHNLQRSILWRLDISLEIREKIENGFPDQILFFEETEEHIPYSKKTTPV